MTRPTRRYKRYQTRCMWCRAEFWCARQEADTCSGKCRTRLFRYRSITGFDPSPSPGPITVKAAVDALVAELIAKERIWRIKVGRG